MIRFFGELIQKRLVQLICAIYKEESEDGEVEDPSHSVPGEEPEDGEV